MGRTGTSEACPCPWCAHPNNFQEEEALGMLELGNSFYCEKCSRPFELIKMRKATLIEIEKKK